MHYVTEVFPPCDCLCKFGNFELAWLVCFENKVGWHSLVRYSFSKLHLEINKWQYLYSNVYFVLSKIRTTVSGSIPVWLQAGCRQWRKNHSSRRIRLDLSLQSWSKVWSDSPDLLRYGSRSLECGWLQHWRQKQQFHGTSEDG